jgi:hypothetical protein
VQPFPLLAARDETVVVPAPGSGPGNWSGAPSAVQDEDGDWVVAYRTRTPGRRGAQLVVARGPDGEHVTPIAGVDRERFGAESLERPALVRTQTGRWRLYVSCATPESKHWRIELLEADRPDALPDAEAVPVFPGDALLAVKDPVVRRGPAGWQAWICCHPLDEPGEEDRMHTRYAVSPDGVAWEWRGVALTGRPGGWDARGARVTAVLPDGRACYDGRATKEENFRERTGRAALAGSAGALVPQGEGPVADVRYVDVVPIRDGGYRLYYEAPLPDGSHELRTALVPAGS